MTSLVHFFNQFQATITKAEKINTHGGSLRIFVKKGKNLKTDKSIKLFLNEEDKFGIKDYKTYQNFGKKVYEIRKNVLENIKKLKNKNKKIIGYGSPAKATTALNFFGIKNEIDYVVEDNKLKHGKFIPGVNIQIKNKENIKDTNNIIIVLAWNFFEEIKKNNPKISNNFISIKELEN